MLRRFALLAVVAVMTLVAALPAMAQDAYPPDEEPGSEVIERDGDEADEVVERDTTEVQGVALERDEGTLPVTGATIGVIAAVAAAVLLLGSMLLVSTRRRKVSS
jgi:LPXTG-motif cell wall-anchored protein